MDNFMSILDQIRINEDAAKKAESESAILWKEKERQTAAAAGNYTALKAIKITDADKERAAELLERAAELRTSNKILQENARASFAEYITPMICEIMQRYSGKQYGEKTREKIRQAAKDKGFSFYFRRDYDGAAFYIEADLLTPEGFTDYRLRDIRLSATTADGKSADFISTQNTITDFSKIEIKSRYHYTEDTQSRRAALDAAYQKYIEAYEATKAAESALNALLPDGVELYYQLGAYPHKRF